MNEIELWVFDMKFNRLGIIDKFELVELDTKYHDHSPLRLIVEGNQKHANLLLSDDDRIIAISNDISHGYYIETPQYRDDAKVTIEVLCRSLSVMTGWRIVKGQQRYLGNIEDVIKSFINYNAITTNSNRIIPDLVLGENDGINISVDETYTNYQLDTAIWEICKKYDIGFEILMDHVNKKYVANTFQGIDRTAEQSVNSHVIFAKAFDNVNYQSYVDDKADYKSAAYVETTDRTLVVNDSSTGFSRRELFVDAKSISKTYVNENGIEVTMTDSEFVTTLNETGNSELASYPRVRSFESEIDTNSQFVYGIDFFIGDKVTNRSDELGIATYSRVVTAKEIWNSQGYSLGLEFGTSIPTLLDKIKREVKK